MKSDLEGFCVRALAKFPELKVPFSWADDYDPESGTTKIETFGELTYLLFKEGLLSTVSEHVAFVMLALNEANDDLADALVMDYVDPLFCLLSDSERRTLFKLSPEFERCCRERWPATQ